MDVSITIIGHNEVDHLRELLPQLLWADEIIYVDCESQDDSLEVAKKEGCRVFSRPNNNNLNINKSFAIEQAKSDWIFYLDPDERISESLANEIKKLNKDSIYAAFKLNRKNHCFGKWLKYGSQYPDKQIRFFRRGSAKFENKNVHEKLLVNGNIGILKNDLLHFPYQNISQFLRKFDFYTGLEAGYLFDAGVSINFSNTLKFLVLKPFPRFFRRYFLKGGFIDGLPGLFFAIFDALNFTVRYIKLWENLKTTNENKKKKSH